MSEKNPLSGKTNGNGGLSRSELLEKSREFKEINERFRASENAAVASEDAVAPEDEIYIHRADAGSLVPGPDDEIYKEKQEVTSDEDDKDLSEGSVQKHFLSALDTTLAEMQAKGEISPEEVADKRKNAQLIENGFSGDVEQDAELFAHAGVSDEKTLVGILEKRHQGKRVEKEASQNPIEKSKKNTTVGTRVGTSVKEKKGAPKATKKIEELKTEIDELTEQEKHPEFKVNDRRIETTPNTNGTDFEAEILSREAKIREIESIEKEKEIRERLAKLENEAKHPLKRFMVTDKRISAGSKDNPEQEMLKLENELRGLERNRKGLLAKEENEEVVESDQSNKGTPAEEKEKLKKLVEALAGKEEVEQKEKIVENEAKSEFVGEMNKELDPENLKQMLENRSAELDVEAKKLGIEGWFRRQGEAYNKLNWKTKLGVGLALGVGATAFSTVSVPLALACVSNLALQRVMGMSSMFMKFEDSKYFAKLTANVSENRRKADAMAAAALLYSLGFGYGITKAVNWAADTSAGHAVHDWLSSHWPFGNSSPITGPKVTTGGAAREAVIHHPSSAPAAYEVSVKASPGHGYEYMTKRLWEQLQGKGLDPNKFAPDSDIHKLLTANAKSIDGVVHRIAMDSKHGFFNADGTSVQINPDDHLTILPDGQIHIENDATDYNLPTHAPEGAHITPAYHPEVPVSSVVESSTPDMYAQVHEKAAEARASLPNDIEDAAKSARDYQAAHPSVEQSVSHVETPTTPIENHTQTPEAPNVPEMQTFVTSVDHVSISSEAPAIYQAQAPTGETYLVAYGGSDEARYNFIQDFLTHPENQGKSIRFAHTVSSLFGSRVQVDELGAQTAAGHTSWFTGFFSKPIELPDPKNFEKLIK
ncbi:MAG: hypothetical protein WCS97_02950 [Candidatus Paceibacterota bacterium]|jgi:hypothetical protein